MGLGRPKQYLPVYGRALLEWSLAPFLDAGWIDGIALVLPKGDTEYAKLPIARHPKIVTVTGGAARGESVLAGLEAVTERCLTLDAPVFLLVHDAARPCLTVEDVETLRDEASDEQGGLLAMPLTDTLKSEERQRSLRTIGPAGLWRAQAPQLFRIDLLRTAYQQAHGRNLHPVDEAEAMELAGFKPQLIRGRVSNLKVTYPEDLPLAEFWLSRREYAR
jgi:2-C-methyl-D-erythritol 4-phosphate cytidylyltransferase